MTLRTIDVEQERELRELRLHIGRLRRRMEGRIRSGQREVGRLTSWRTYVSHYPGSAIAAAFGVGLAFSAGLRGRPLARRFGLRLFRRSIGLVGRHLWGEALSAFGSTTSPPEAAPRGNDARTCNDSGAGDSKEVS